MVTLFTVAGDIELIMDIAMSDTSGNQRENIEQSFIMTQRII